MLKIPFRVYVIRPSSWFLHLTRFVVMHCDPTCGFAWWFSLCLCVLMRLMVLLWVLVDLISGAWTCYCEEDYSGSAHWDLWWSDDSWTMQHDCGEAWRLSGWAGSLDTAWYVFVWFESKATCTSSGGEWKHIWCLRNDDYGLCLIVCVLLWSMVL